MFYKERKVLHQFKNVTVKKKANIYFEGKVISRKIIFGDGSIKTLGVMLPGEYEFNTEEKEIIEITSGKMEILIANELEWKKIETGMTFEVPASSSFKLKVAQVTSYFCSYIKE